MTSRGVGNWSDSKSITTVKGKGKCGLGQLREGDQEAEHQPETAAASRDTSLAFILTAEPFTLVSSFAVTCKK